MASSVRAEASTRGGDSSSQVRTHRPNRRERADLPAEPQKPRPGVTRRPVRKCLRAIADGEVPRERIRATTSSPVARIAEVGGDHGDRAALGRPELVEALVLFDARAAREPLRELARPDAAGARIRSVDDHLSRMRSAGAFVAADPRVDADDRRPRTRRLSRCGDALERSRRCAWGSAGAGARDRISRAA